MSEQKFFICKHCGNLVGMIFNSGAPLVCCGDEMSELVPNTVDASKEKHVPVATAEKDAVKVEVGSAPHPMTEQHYIQWVYLQTDAGGQRKSLNPDDAPIAEFALKNEKPLAVFAYCNLHGLWKTEL